MARRHVATIVELTVVALLCTAVALTSFYLTKNYYDKKIEYEFLNNILEDNKTGFIITDHNGSISSWSIGATNLLYYSREEMVDRNITDIIPLGFKRDFLRLIKIASAKKNNSITHIFKCVVIRKDGLIMPVVVIVRSSINKFNKIVYLRLSIQPQDTFVFSRIEEI